MYHNVSLGIFCTHFYMSAGIVWGDLSWLEFIYWNTCMYTLTVSVNMWTLWVLKFKYRYAHMNIPDRNLVLATCYCKVIIFRGPLIFVNFFHFFLTHLCKKKNTNLMQVIYVYKQSWNLLTQLHIKMHLFRQ